MGYVWKMLAQDWTQLTDEEKEKLFRGTNYLKPTVEQLKTLGKFRILSYSNNTKIDGHVVEALPFNQLLRPKNLLYDIEKIHSVYADVELYGGDATILHLNDNYYDEASKLDWLPKNGEFSADTYKFGTHSLKLNGDGYITSQNNIQDYNFSDKLFSIDMWVYPTDNSTVVDLVSFSKEGYGVNLSLFSGGVNNITLKVGTNNSGIWQINQTDTVNDGIKLNDWNHIAIAKVLDGKDKLQLITVYVNGFPVLSTSLEDSISFSETEELVIGKNLKGYIDEVIICKGYNRFNNEWPDPQEEYTQIKELPDIRFSLTKDNFEYYIYRNDEFTKLSLFDLDTMLSEGMTANELNNIPTQAWELFYDDKAKAFNIGMAFKIADKEQICKINKLEAIVDKRDVWKKAYHGTDYDYEYSSVNNIKVTLLTNGDYKINYCDPLGDDDEFGIKYGAKFDGVTPTGVRTHSAKKFIWEPSTNTYEGRDDFKDIPPFNVKECLTYWDATAGKRKFHAYKDDSVDYANDRKSGNYDVMIEFPVFYYKRPSELEWVVSPEPLEGFQPSPMHYRNGKLYKKARVSKYHVNSAYKSLSGQASLVNVNLQTFRNGLRARGLYVIDYPTMCSIQMLTAIKYGTLDTQSVVGYGFANTGNTAKRNTGATDNVKGLDGSPTALNANEQVVAFGMEDMWGNIWTFVDGFIRYGGANGSAVYINPDIENIKEWPTAANINDTWIRVDTPILVSSNQFGYPKTIAYDKEFPWMSYPTSYYTSWSTSSTSAYNSPSGPFCDGEL